ncbi:MAG: hypothetical protein HY756_02615 [Nitrospirae bacterium]|nr:hypothetical protein [Nitrospirota bacterium]
MTKEELKTYCDSEFKNIDMAMDELFSIVTPEKPEYSLRELAAISTFILNIYTGIEKTLKQMLLYDSLDVTDSPHWHEKVLKKSAEIGILPPDLFQVLTRYLSFRTVFTYSYIFNIKWEDLKVLVDAIKDIEGKFKSEVNEYIQML